MTLREVMKQAKSDLELYTSVRNHTTKNIRDWEKKPPTRQIGKLLREARNDREKYNRKITNLNRKILRLKVKMK